MKRAYRFTQLSKDEQEFLEMVLMEELGQQVWVAIAYSVIMSEEIFISMQ